MEKEPKIWNSKCTLEGREFEFRQDLDPDFPRTIERLREGEDVLRCNYCNWKNELQYKGGNFTNKFICGNCSAEITITRATPLQRILFSNEI